MYRAVLRMGDERLWQRAEPVSQFDTPQLHALLADMRDTMQALNGAGLAAPQIGVGLRVVIFGVRLRHVTAQQPVAGAAACHPLPHQTLTRAVSGGQHNPRYPDADTVPATVLINPVISHPDEEMAEDWEGCLSVPGLRGMVPRHAHIRYRGQDEYGARIDRTVSGFHARVVQHECDHLDGILYPMRIRDMTKFGFAKELFPGQELQDE
ncbi:MAG: peptide deformylase [Gallionella sp.]|nr:peptide deformylase [Gallionella sp.]